MDKRLIKTRERLWRALFKLMKTKSIADITVTELCDVAGITRRTFYRSFNNVMAVFDSYSDTLSDRSKEALSAHFTDVDHLLAAVDETVVANYEGLKLIYTDPRHGQLRDNFVDDFYQSLVRIVLPDPTNVHNQLVMKYVASGVMGMFSEWFKSFTDVSYGDFAKMVKPLIHNSLTMLE